jgi:hypothetical protein
VYDCTVTSVTLRGSLPESPAYNLCPTFNVLVHEIDFSRLRKITWA